MCLEATRKDTRVVSKQLKEAGGTITCWKVMQRCERAKGGVCGGLYHYDWKRGENTSASDRMMPIQKATRIEHGFHVHLTRDSAKQWARFWNFSPWRIVPIECHLKDFIGADATQAVFRKVTITAKAWKILQRLRRL